MNTSTMSAGGSASNLDAVRRRAAGIDFSEHVPVGIYLDTLGDKLAATNGMALRQGTHMMASIVIASEWLIKPETAPKGVAPAHLASAVQSVRNLEMVLDILSSQEGRWNDEKALGEVPKLVSDIARDVGQVMAAGSADPALMRGPAAIDPLAPPPANPTKDTSGADKSAPPKQG